MSTLGRVAVTRPEGRGRSLAMALELRGMEVVAVPLIETRLAVDLTPLREALDRSPALVVVSSATAVPALAGAGGASSPLRVAAVGPATTAALDGAGIAVAVVGDGSGGAALAERIGGPDHAGSRAVVLAAADGRRELIDDLGSAGWDVEVIVVYETVARRVPDEDVMALDACDVVCFASPSAVEAFRGLRDPMGRPLRPRPAVVIGKTTAQAARDAGFTVTMAERASDGAMAGAAAQVLSDRRGS